MIRTALFALALVCAQSTAAQIRLPRIVRDSMVLQRDSRINIWGWASPGEKVTVKFAGKKAQAVTSPDGRWQLQLPPVKAGGPHIMQLEGSNRIVLRDILVGDVYLCAGQSNMVHQMELHKETYAADIRTANYSQVRQFWVPTLTSVQGPQPDLPAGNWKSANPEDVRQFSAVAYFFALQLHQQYKVPVGIINTSVGGTPVEAWTSEAGFREWPDLGQAILRNRDTAYIGTNLRQTARYNTLLSERQLADKGMQESVHWYDTAYMPKGWRTINIPGYWEDQGLRNLDGVVWYRKEIVVPESMAGQPAQLYLGRIVDADQVYLNGQPVGTTTYQYPQRRYRVAAGALKAGRNVLTIRVINHAGKGGFVPDKPYRLVAAGESVDLKGEWQYKVGAAFTPVPATPGIAMQNQPAALYNAMVAPLVPYTLRGMVWYQGESNATSADAYAQLFPSFIRNWRQVFAQGNLPFLFVQLPNFMDADYLPAESGWARMREAQAAALAEPNTAMAVAIDLGEWNDIHPDNKKDVGLRLARAAQKLVYGEDVVASGPVFRSAKPQDGKLIITFTETGGGLVTGDGEAPGHFAIAGADKRYVWAQTRLEGNTVLAWNDSVPQPVYVRYAWADNPLGANLYNREGLPAAPFRTDAPQQAGTASGKPQYP